MKIAIATDDKIIVRKSHFGESSFFYVLLKVLTILKKIENIEPIFLRVTKYRVKHRKLWESCLIVK